MLKVTTRKAPPAGTRAAVGPETEWTVPATRNSSTKNSRGMAGGKYDSAASIVEEVVLSAKQGRAFESQQRFLPPELSAVTSESAVLVHDAVAGYDDGDAIRAVGPSDRARGGDHADGSGDVLVRSRFTVRDALQFGPDALLERRSRRDHRNGEPGQRPGEVRVELVAQPLEMRIVAGDRIRSEPSTDDRRLRREPGGLRELKHAHAARARSRRERAERAVDRLVHAGHWR